MYYQLDRPPLHRHIRFRRRANAVVLFGVLTALFGAGLLVRQQFVDQSVVNAAGSTYYVAPDGADTNSGTIPGSPWATIQKAVDTAGPGDTVSLAPGTYLQDVITRRDGAPDQPITISGPISAVVKGAGKSRIFEINHSYLTLTGFTVDGQFGPGGAPIDFREKLIYVQGKGIKSGVHNLKLLNLTLQHAKGECVRLRYFAQSNEVAYNIIRHCGVADFVFNGGSKNGEGIYIGTAPEQLADGKNPTADPDESTNNRIHHNNFNTQGNECVDLKEATHDNVVEYNECTGQLDPNSGGFDSRGNNNTFRYNNDYGNAGSGVRLGGDTADQGINNHVYANQITGNASGGIKFMAPTEGKICDNTMSNNAGGDAAGTYKGNFKPTKSCSMTSAPNDPGGEPNVFITTDDNSIDVPKSSAKHPAPVDPNIPRSGSPSSTPSLQTLQGLHATTVTGQMKIEPPDNGGQALKVEVYMDGSSVPITVGQSLAYLGTQNLPNGPHTLLTRVTDKDGKIADSASKVIVNNPWYMQDGSQGWLTLAGSVGVLSAVVGVLMLRFGHGHVFRAWILP